MGSYRGSNPTQQVKAISKQSLYTFFVVYGLSFVSEFLLLRVPETLTSCESKFVYTLAPGLVCCGIGAKKVEALLVLSRYMIAASRR